MRTALFGLMVLVLTVAVAGAENKAKSSKQAEGFKKEKIVKLKAGYYSKVYLNTYYRAKNLELDKSQQQELSRVGKRFAKTITRNEHRMRVLQRKFMKQLDTAPFDASKLKELATDMMAKDTQTIDSFIEGMSAIVTIIGPENFSKLSPISKFDRKSLVQLKQSSTDELLEDKDEESADAPK